jgi:hypothetical protein
MDTTYGQPLLQAPGLGFQVLHYHRSSFDPDSSIIVHHIGIYPTFALAQTAALFALHRIVNDYLRIGYHGRYYEQIDLNLWGLVTAYKESTLDGYVIMREIPMNEFRLETLDVWDNAWESDTRLAGEELQFGNPRGGIFANMQGTGRAFPAVRLPADPEQPKEPATPKHIARRGEHVVMPEPAPSSPQFPPLGPQYDEECQPEWSRTRMPLFDQRDDGPFRRPSETPYAQVMVLSPAAPTSSAECVPSNSTRSMMDAVATS